LIYNTIFLQKLRSSATLSPALLSLGEAVYSAVRPGVGVSCFTMNGIKMAESYQVTPTCNLERFAKVDLIVIMKIKIHFHVEERHTEASTKINNYAYTIYIFQCISLRDATKKLMFNSL
jgi:hypothetical protein